MFGVEKLSTERLIYISSLLLLAFSGLAIIGINNHIKTSKSYIQLALTKALWKFESDDNLKTKYSEKCWAWRKLVLAGIMMVSLVSSLAIKVVDVNRTIGLASGLFAIWVGYLCHYWRSVDITRSCYEKPNTVDSVVSINSGADAWLKRALNKEQLTDNRLPLTIVTGFLGSGKTTLVKNILSNTVGMKVLVIENEIGAQGIDHELLIQHTEKEDIVLMNNGCICCTVRQDLLATFHRLFDHASFAALDWIVIETTGMADPAPLIQSLYMDAPCKARLRLDSVLTMVDCKHIHLHIDSDDNIVIKSDSITGSKKELAKTSSASEAVLQISFADRIILNKTDLVSVSELDALTEIVHGMNPTAKLITCVNSAVPIEELLNIRAFDPLQNKALLSSSSSKNDAIVSTPMLIHCDSNGKILHKVMRFGASLSSSSSSDNPTTSSSNSKHKVQTVSLYISDKDDEGGGAALDLNKFNMWMSKLLSEQGANIYRLKGILCMEGYKEQFIAHGVHMLFDGQRGQSWKSNSSSTTANTVTSAESITSNSPKDNCCRYSKLVFIGLKLDKVELEAQFLACRSSSSCIV